MSIPIVDKIVKYVEANTFKIKLIISSLRFVGWLLFLAFLSNAIFGFNNPKGGTAVFCILAGITMLVITHFVSYRHGFKKASEEIRRLKKSLTEHRLLTSEVDKLQKQIGGLQGEVSRKKEAFHHLKNEIKKIKSQEKREALEQLRHEIKDKYEMHREKILEKASPVAQKTTQRIKVIVGGLKSYLIKGVEEAKRQSGIFRVFRKKEKGGTLT